MAIKTKVDPINRDIELMISQNLSPSAQSALFAEFAGEQIEEAKQTNQSILGRIPRYTVAVDGRVGASLESVSSKGVISVEFALVNDTLAWIADQLSTHSPTKSGRYKKSHTLFDDGHEVDVGGVIPDADEFVFINTVPYSNKIERGSSSQAPDGVYQVVAVLAATRFGNIAKISFSYRAPFAGSFLSARQGGNKAKNRQPAIIVKVGKS
jgi:hypothetical protein